MLNSKEFSYVSSILICGDKSSKAKQFKVFNLNIFKKHKDISVQITRTRKGENRVIPLTEYSHLSSKVIYSGKTQEFAPIITFLDTKNHIKVSDTIFNSDEFEVFNKNIKNLINRKVEATGSLIQALYLKDILTFPLLISDFPNISKLVLGESTTIFK